MTIYEWKRKKQGSRRAFWCCFLGALLLALAFWIPLALAQTPPAPITATAAGATVTMSWTPTPGAVSFELYFWNSARWQLVQDGPQPRFSIVPLKGTFRWMAADVMPDGTRAYQKAYGFWTFVPK